MFIKTETHISDFEAWGGGEITLEAVREADKMNELENLILEEYGKDVPTETEINDFLCFCDNFILNALGIEEE